MHVIVLVHGLHGTYHDFDYLSKQLDGKVLVAKSHDGKTHSGLDKMSAELIQEIDEFCDGLQDVHLSLLGHSLGSLIVRHSMPQLGKKYKLHAFYSICGPHLGSRRMEGTVMGLGASFYLQYLLGPTGKELYDYSVPLTSYGLKHLYLIGNVQDLTVPLSSALIMPHHSFRSAQQPFTFQVREVDNPNSDVKHEQEWVNGVNLSYRPKLLQGVNQLDIKRIIIDFNIPEDFVPANTLGRMCVHALVVGKRMTPIEYVHRACCASKIGSNLVRLSKQSAEYLAQLISKNL